MKAFRPDPDERLNEVPPNYQQLSVLRCNSVSDVGSWKRRQLKARSIKRSNRISAWRNDGNPLD